MPLADVIFKNFTFRVNTHAKLTCTYGHLGSDQPQVYSSMLWSEYAIPSTGYSILVLIQNRNL